MAETPNVKKVLLELIFRDENIFRDDLDFRYASRIEISQKNIAIRG